jgi:hypothetical protein
MMEYWKVGMMVGKRIVSNLSLVVSVNAIQKKEDIKVPVPSIP